MRDADIRKALRARLETLHRRVRGTRIFDELGICEGRVRADMAVVNDCLHGFEIKQFKVSKEIPRGSEPVTIEFTASEVGTFPILCSLFCGDGHNDMKGALVVTARAVARR